MAIEYLTRGTDPAIETNVSNAEMINYFVIDNVVYPGHGKVDPIASPGQSRAIFNAASSSCLYSVNGSEFGCLDEAGIFTLISTLGTKTSRVEMNVNPASQVLIVDEENGYVFDPSTNSFINITASIPSFTIENPKTCIMVDTFFIVANGRTIQLSEPNTGLNWNPDTLAYESGEDEIVSLALIDRVVFVISQFNIERYVINVSDNPAAPILIRDNVFLIESGISDPKSFVNDFNVAIGIFRSRSGGDGVRMLVRGSNDLIELTTPGLIKKMRTFGDVDSATLYELNNIRYYELTFRSSGNTLHSFIYNFRSKTWTESSQPSQKLGIVGNTAYAALESDFYRITEYRNSLVKCVLTPPVDLPGQGATLTEAALRVRFKDAEDIRFKFRLGGQVDGVFQLTPRDYSPLSSQLIQEVTYYPRVDALSYAFIIETQSNAVLTNLTYKVDNK